VPREFGHHIRFVSRGCLIVWMRASALRYAVAGEAVVQEVGERQWHGRFSRFMDLMSAHEPGWSGSFRKKPSNEGYQPYRL
jgi:hypothetical protein